MKTNVKGCDAAIEPSHHPSNTYETSTVAASWPSNVIHLSQPLLSPYLTQEQREWLLKKPQPCDIPVLKLSSDTTEINANITVVTIEDIKHPANGQFGLFAARNLDPEELVIPYLGYVHSSTESEQSTHDEATKGQSLQPLAHTACTSQAQTSVAVPRQDLQDFEIGFWDNSDYDLNLHRDEDIELAVDASRVGNEARFCNDYRGVPTQQVIPDHEKQWSRKSKRSAKSWAAPQASLSDCDAIKAGITMPNAEFRDVWFELGSDSVEDGVLEAFNELAVSPSPSHVKDAPEVINNNLRSSSDNAGAVTTTMKPSSSRRKKKVGMRGVAIFVLPAGKSGKRKNGIRAGQEILVSYGKGFWAHHGHNDVDLATEPP